MMYMYHQIFRTEMEAHAWQSFSRIGTSMLIIIVDQQVQVCFILAMELTLAS